MLMDALMTYSSSESEDEYEKYSSAIAIANDEPSVYSDNDGTNKDESMAVFSGCINETGSVQTLEAVHVMSEVNDFHNVTKHMNIPVTRSSVSSAASEVVNAVDESNFSVAESSVTSVVEDFFNLSEQADVSNAGDISTVQLVHDSQQQSAVCSERAVDFWNTDVIAEDWTHPEKIWGTATDLTESGTGHVSDKIVNLASDVVVTKVKGYSSKRHQSDISYELSPSTESSVTVKKSCFVVHHKIAPQLHTVTQTVNRIPQKVLRVLPGHSGTVNRIHWGIPEYSHLLLTASMDATVRVWNVMSSRGSDSCVRTFKVHSKAVKAARWSACCRQILSCSYDKFAKLTDVESGSELCCFQHQDYISCITFNPVDRNLFISGLTNLMLCWDKRCPSKPVRQYAYKDRFGQVQDVCFFNNGSQFLSCNDIVGRDSPDRTIMVWDFATRAVLSNQIFQERYTCTRLCVHPTEPKFFAQTNGDYIAEFSALPPYRINKCKRFEGHKVSGYSVGFDISPDGKLIASGSSDSRMLVYDYRLARVLRSLLVTDVNDVVLDVAWHPVLFSTVAAATWNGHVLVWQ